MTEFAVEYERNRVEFERFVKDYHDLSDENHRIGIHLHLIQDRLSDLETRTKKLSEQLRSGKH